MRALVVGGGLAGLAAALELVDAAQEVTLLEARPTLGGAVQTLPARPGDPEPPPDNGQHIALGCFTEYLRFLGRIGESDALLRKRLALPVIAEDRSVSAIEPNPIALLRYRHLSLRDRVAIPRVLWRLRTAAAEPGESFGALLRRVGTSDAGIVRFWDVFVRPALNLPSDEASAEAGLFTVRTALLGPRANADLMLPLKPLGRMHGDAAGSALVAAGAEVRTDARVVGVEDDVLRTADGKEFRGDALVLAVPPQESARLLGEPVPGLEDSPIVSVHLWFDRRLLPGPLAALLGSDAHWVFDRGELTGHPPERGQYLTVVSSGVPELLEVRGRDLVERISGQLTRRLGDATLLWSRVSREPRATIALRPGVERPGVETGRPRIVRAGAWTDTGWPATMESAVRSGRRAAQHLLRDFSARLSA